MPRRLTLGGDADRDPGWTAMAQGCDSAQRDVLLRGLPMMKAIAESHRAGPASLTPISEPALAEEAGTLVFTSRRGKAAAGEGEAS